MATGSIYTGESSNVTISSIHRNIATNAGSSRINGKTFICSWSMKQTGAIAPFETLLSYDSLNLAWSYGILIKGGACVGAVYSYGHDIIADTAISHSSGTEYLTIILITSVI